MEHVNVLDVDLELKLTRLLDQPPFVNSVLQDLSLPILVAVNHALLELLLIVLDLENALNVLVEHKRTLLKLHVWNV